MPPKCLPWPASLCEVLLMPCVVLHKAALCCMVEGQKPLLCTDPCKAVPRNTVQCCAAPALRKACTQDAMHVFWCLVSLALLHRG